MLGIRESARTNATLVAIKLAVVVFVIFAGWAYVHPANWTSIPVAERASPRRKKLIPDAVKEYLADMAGKASERRGRSSHSGRKASRWPTLPHRCGKQRADAPTQRRKQAHGKPSATAKASELAVLSAGVAGHLPQTEADRQAVEKSFPSLTDRQKEAEVKSWGILGTLGLNRWLLPIDDATRSPFMPYGLSGIMLGAAIVFFAFIGFDSISTHAEEARRPATRRAHRDPGLAGALHAAVHRRSRRWSRAWSPIRISISMPPSRPLLRQQPAPDSLLAAVLAGPDCRGRPGRHDERAARAILEPGADLHGHVARRAVAADFQHGPSPLPHAARGHDPHRRGDLPYGRLYAHLDLEEMVNVGTLMAFVMVCAAVWVLRFQRPSAERPFRCPAIWLVAPAGILINVTMTLFLSVATWIRLVGWLAVGLVIYFNYSLRHSHLAKHLMQEIRTPRKEVTGTQFDPEVVE